MNFVRFPLNVLSGFPIAFCYGSPPQNFSRYPTALSQIFLKHSGFPAAFCQVSLQYFVKSSLGILSRHPGILAGFSPAFLAGFPQAFSQVSVTNCHYPLILLGEERERGTANVSYFSKLAISPINQGSKCKLLKDLSDSCVPSDSSLLTF